MIGGATGSTKYAIIDAFKNFLAVVNPVTGWHGEYDTKLKKYKGFSSAFKAFKTLRVMAIAIEDNWPQLGTRFMQWMVNDRLDLSGNSELGIGDWKTWDNDQFLQITNQVYGEDNNWEIFNNIPQQSISYATQMIYTITLLSQMTRDITSPDITATKIKKGNNVNSFHILLNNFIAIMSKNEIGMEYITYDYLKDIQSKDKHTAALKDGGQGKWLHFSFNTAQIINAFSSFCRSVFTIGQSDQKSQQNDLEFNSFIQHILSLKISSNIKDSITWNPSTIENPLGIDKWHLSEYKDVKRYMGCRESGNRYVYMGQNGPIYLNFDSGPESYIAYWATHLRIDSETTLEVLIGSEESGIKAIYDREYYRNLPSDQIPRRALSVENGIDQPPLDDPNRDQALCYLDVGFPLSNGQIIHIEHLGAHSYEYAGRKNLAVDGFREKKLAVIYSHDDLELYGQHYVDESHRAVTEHAFLGLFELIPAFFNVIHMNARRETPYRNLPLNEALANAKLNPTAYYISPEEAELLCDRFRIDDSGTPYGNQAFFNNL